MYSGVRGSFFSTLPLLSQHLPLSCYYLLFFGIQTFFLTLFLVVYNHLRHPTFRFLFYSYSSPFCIHIQRPSFSSPSLSPLPSPIFSLTTIFSFHHQSVPRQHLPKPSCLVSPRLCFDVPWPWHSRRTIQECQVRCSCVRTWLRHPSAACFDRWIFLLPCFLSSLWVMLFCLSDILCIEPCARVVWIDHQVLALSWNHFITFLLSLWHIL